MSDEMQRVSTPDNGDDVAASGLTRAGVLRLLGSSAAAAAGLELIAAPGARAADKQKAAAHRKDLTVLQYALSLEYLGAAFYQTALHAGNLTGDAHTAALAFRAHERSHVQFVQAKIRAFGGTPHKTETFDFGAATASQTAFLKTSAQLEELCVETLNGAAAIVSTPTLTALATIVSVEARQAAWVRAILSRNPAPTAATPALTAAKSKTAFNKLHLTQEKFR
jgi:hypothetical protein